MRKEMLSCQRAFLRLQFPSQLEPSKTMRQVGKYRHGMDNQPSTRAEGPPRKMQCKSCLCRSPRTTSCRLLDTGQGETGHTTINMLVKMGIQLAGTSIKVL